MKYPLVIKYLRIWDLSSSLIGSLSHDSHLTVRGYLPTNAMKKEKQDEEN